MLLFIFLYTCKLPLTLNTLTKFYFYIHICGGYALSVICIRICILFRVKFFNWCRWMLTTNWSQRNRCIIKKRFVSMSAHAKSWRTHTHRERVPRQASGADVERCINIIMQWSWLLINIVVESSVFTLVNLFLIYVGVCHIVFDSKLCWVCDMWAVWIYDYHHQMLFTFDFLFSFFSFHFKNHQMTTLKLKWHN